MRSITMACVLGLLALGGLADAGVQKTDKIPITTSSEEARRSYLEGRDLLDKLRATDAHKHFQAAWAKDKSFALAAVGIANTSATAVEFWEALGNATALASKVSEGERLLIEALEAGAKGDPARQKAAVMKLVKAYPGDERAHNALGGWYFGQQDWNAAIGAYKKATSIEPTYSPPYNLMGYSYRFVEKYADAEAAFVKYIELIPGDPNPYDSLAELLMKMGRFDESIVQYQKALSVDPNFVNSYVGIGNNQIFMGKPADARKSFDKVGQMARNVGEKRTANFWTSQSYLFEGQTDKALAAMHKNLAIAEQGKDWATAGGDHAIIADILLAAGRTDEARKHFQAQVDSTEKAAVPAEVKEAARRGWHYDEGRVALAAKDLAGAKAHLAAYTKLVAVKKNINEVRAQHELAGVIALEEKKPAVAVAELRKANQLDPRVLYHLGLALERKGDTRKAREVLAKAADFNAFAVTYPLVRKLARDARARTDGAG